MPNNGIPEYFATVYFYEKTAIADILNAQQNQEGATSTVTVYLFLDTIPCLSYF